MGRLLPWTLAVIPLLAWAKPAPQGPSTKLAPLAEPVALFDESGDLSEWVWFTEADGVERADVVSVEEGVLSIAGRPSGYLATRRWYRDYVLELEWRWPGERGGNSGVLVHTTTPLLFYGWPKSMEVQLQAGSAGDFWVIGDGTDIRVEDEATRRRAPREGDLHTHRRIANLTDDSERPLGEWNHMRIECRADQVLVHVNGTLVNHGTASTVTQGAIALQSEGTPIQFRSLHLTPLP